MPRVSAPSRVMVSFSVLDNFFHKTPFRVGPYRHSKRPLVAIIVAFHSWILLSMDGRVFHGWKEPP